MALSARAIVTLNDFKNYIGLNLGATADDSIFESWIDWVSGKFESAIDNVVNSIEKTIYLNGSGESYQYLPYFPVVALYTPAYSDVQYRASATADWGNIVTDVDLIHVNAVDSLDILELLDGNIFPEGDKNIKIHYYAGYSTVPADITVAILEALQIMYKQSQRFGGRLGLASASQIGAVESYVDTTPLWNQIVRRYHKNVSNVEVYR